MIKNLLLVLIVLLTSNQFSFATNSNETVIGPVIAIKRSFNIDSKSCYETYKFSYTTKLGQCKVAFSKKNNTELFVSGPNKTFSYSGLEPNSRVIVNLETNTNSYTFNLKYKSLNNQTPRGNMWYYIDKAISDYKRTNTKPTEVFVYQPHRN